MSGIVIASTAAALTTVATVMIATFPELSQAIAPVFETSREYAVASIAIIFAVPALAMMTLLAAAAKD